MLDNIRMHLLKEESEQIAIETKAAATLEQTFKRNKQAFSRYIPALNDDIKTLSWQNMGIFCNKQGRFNIVDKSLGRTLYGLQPDDEIHQQYLNRIENAPTIDLSDDNENEDARLGLATEIECLVVMGIGIGAHFDQLTANHKIEHCIIYEPEKQYFFASMLCFDWHKILKRCHENKVNLYFQLGKDASNFIADIKELKAHFPVNQVSIYKHYNIPTFNAIERESRVNTWSTLRQSGISWARYSSNPFELSRWTAPSDLSKWNPIKAEEHQLFVRNIASFEQYFPDIAAKYKQYETQRWKPVQDDEGNINLLSIDYPESYHGNEPQTEGKLNYQTFADYPNRDGLVLGYDGTKLKQYTHYKFVSATETLLEDLEEQQGALPEDIKAMIIFGLASGYQVEALLDDHSIENIFICEPEPDFFYASLFAIDWAKILQQVDETDGRIYINIGDNGANLFRDLISQFYAIGPYVLVNTFFYQSYFRPDLVAAVNQLREQLQVVIALGECYDHARYGIAHTTHVIDQGVPFLRNKAPECLDYDTKETPVFIVGNGPSLDHSIALIQEHKDKAIVVSCGTALQVLFKNGIKPDFHAEIEQNRSTFDWVTRAADTDYLKSITLISCNGIHPDTCELFDKVLLAFKEGESSTVSALNLVDKSKWSTLEFAFPTVTNFVINLFLEMQLSQLYLFGVDLGFVDEKTHHSKQSGYYANDGDELYNYAEKNAISISVPGNFKPSVSTKYEFKVAKEIIEQSLSGRNVECFNCSDGARIAGTIPLQLDNVLLVSTEEQKQSALSDINTKAFARLMPVNTYMNAFDNKYGTFHFEDELNALVTEVNATLDQKISVDALILKQKEILYNSYESGSSLLFYLLYGTSNYANAVLSKLQLVNAAPNANDCGLDTAVESTLNHWKNALLSIQSEFCAFPKAVDFVSSMHVRRERKVLAEDVSSKCAYFLCEHEFTPKFEKWFGHYSAEVDLCMNATEVNTLPDNAVLMILHRDTENTDLLQRVRYVLDNNAKLNVIIADESNQLIESLRQDYPQHDFSWLWSVDPIRTEQQLQSFNDGQRAFHFDELTVGYLARSARIQKPFSFLLPKIRFTTNNPEVKKRYTQRVLKVLESFQYCCDYQEFIIAAHSPEELVHMDGVGNRGRPFKMDERLIHLFRPIVGQPAIDSVNAKFHEGGLGGMTNA